MRIARHATRFALAAILLVSVAGQAAAQKHRMLMAGASMHNVALTVRVNGVLVETFERDQSGGFPLVLWLVNGQNEVKFVGKASGPEPAATGDATLPGRKAPLGAFTWSADKPSLTVTFEEIDVPRWGWVSAPAKPGAKDEVLAAVRAVHKALATGDEHGFRRASSAHFADAVKLLGAKKASAFATSTWKAMSRNLQQLGKLSVESYRGGQIYRVTDESGRAALMAKDADSTPTLRCVLVLRGRHLADRPLTAHRPFGSTAARTASHASGSGASKSPCSGAPPGR